jgi:hypothetical protein
MLRRWLRQRSIQLQSRAYLVHDGPMEARRRATADEAIRWGAGIVCAGIVVAGAIRRGSTGTRTVSLILTGAFGAATYGARRMVANAIAETNRREAHQQILVDAQLGQALGGAHDAINSVEPDLRALLLDGDLAPTTSVTVEDALSATTCLADLLRRSAPARDALIDEDGLVPLVGISAAQQHKRGPRAVRPLYGSRDGLPSVVPTGLRSAARQVGLVLDETRLLHDADVERSVLLFTLFSRAVLVSLSPVLGDWSPVRQPLEGGFRARDIPWAAASATSIATAVAGPYVVRMAMEDSAAGRKFRDRLLMVEVPVGAAALAFSPSWTVVVFASGVTNWWQRQNKGMAFNWGKLPIYVAGVSALQGVGLAREHVALDGAARETVGAFTAILVTGASYGAMLPLTIGTALDVLIGDGKRSLRAVVTARAELLRAARQLNLTADEIDASAPDSEAARMAAKTARRAALQIERAADRAGRRGLMSSHLLPELAAEAVARSFLPRRDTTDLEQQQQQTRDKGEAPPAYATEPIFLSPDLNGARIQQQRHAHAVRSIIEHCLNEARRHGTGGVRLILATDGTHFEVRIGNRPAPGDVSGISGQGGGNISRLAARLPDGVVERGLRPAADVRMPNGEDWWLVRLICSASIFQPAAAV